MPKRIFQLLNGKNAWWVGRKIDKAYSHPEPLNVGMNVLRLHKDSWTSSGLDSDGVIMDQNINTNFFTKTWTAQKTEKRKIKFLK